MSNKYFKESVFIKSATKKEEFLKDRPMVCFLGRSNVGKSTLINRLCSKRMLMKTSKTPGLTRYVNYSLINSQFYICDSPGYGYASFSREHFAKMMEDYLSLANLKKVYILIDSRRLINEEDSDFIFSLKVPLCLIFTKYDKLKSKEKYNLSRQLNLLKENSVQYFVTDDCSADLDVLRIDILKAVER
ncbi:MAG: ribosome biogenesis GTP-binding protein YihA/YsxC [Candidatus Enterosoma sp.]|nr:ribosome biogenesis GTP-binding protein YihA/YsxC [Candidatus Enterosoma sp.]